MDEPVKSGQIPLTSWFTSTDTETHRSCLLFVKGVRCGYEFFDHEIPMPETEPSIPLETNVANLQDQLNIPKDCRANGSYLCMELLRRELAGNH